MRIVKCPTPKDKCTGGTYPFLPGLGGSIRAHSSSDEAFRCYRRYLVKFEGYEPIGPREFRPPDGGPILVLAKRSRFGTAMRLGKEGRHMPRERHGGYIVST